MHDSEIEWEQARTEFEWDGTLRDLYILDAGIDVWQKVFDCLRSGEYPCCYRIEDEERPLPADVGEAFKDGDEPRSLLSIDVDGATLDCHFFDTEEVEFDLDPREINSEERLGSLFGFMRRIGQAAGKRVIMTPENGEHFAIFEFAPETGEIRQGQ